MKELRELYQNQRKLRAKESSAFENHTRGTELNPSQ